MKSLITAITRQIGVRLQVDGLQIAIMDDGPTIVTGYEMPETQEACIQAVKTIADLIRQQDLGEIKPYLCQINADPEARITKRGTEDLDTALKANGAAYAVYAGEQLVLYSVRMDCVRVKGREFPSEIPWRLWEALPRV